MAYILVVDDLKEMTELIEAFLADDGHTVRSAQSAPEAERLLRTERFDLLITDILMPDKNGFDLMKKIFDEMPGGNVPRIIAISGGVRGLGTKAVLEAAAAKADIVLQKPFTRKDLLMAVETALEGPVLPGILPAAS